MKVVLRADADQWQGAGHVMRSLSLSEALLSAGHEVLLLSHVKGLPWLGRYLADHPVDVVDCREDSIPIEALRSYEPDFAVFDSYRFSASEISVVTEDVCSTLAIVDGATRGINASLFLDQNLGAERSLLATRLSTQLLAGARFCLIRSEVRAARHRRLLEPIEPNRMRARLLVTLGGSDPRYATSTALDVLRYLGTPLEVTVVSPHIERIRGDFADWVESGSLHVVAPTPRLEDLLVGADMVWCGGGTSTWEVLTLGIPPILVSLADNQGPTLSAVRDYDLGLALGPLAAVQQNPRGAAARIDEFLGDGRRLGMTATRALNLFDGSGGSRVVEAMSDHLSTRGSPASEGGRFDQAEVTRPGDSSGERNR